MNYLKCFLSKTFRPYENTYIFFINNSLMENFSTNDFYLFLDKIYNYLKILENQSIKFQVVLPDSFYSFMNETDEFIAKINKNKKTLAEFLSKLREFKFVEIFQTINFKNLSYLAYEISKKINATEEEDYSEETINIDFNKMVFTKKVIIEERIKEKETIVYKDMVIVSSFFIEKYNISGVVFEGIDEFIFSLPKKEILSNIKLLNNIFNAFKSENKIKIYGKIGNNFKNKLLQNINFLDHTIIDFEFKKTFLKNLLSISADDKCVANIDFLKYINMANDEHIFMFEQCKTLINESILNKNIIGINFIPDSYFGKLKENGVLYEFKFLEELNKTIINSIINKNLSLKIPLANLVKTSYSFKKMFKGILIKNIWIDHVLYTQEINFCGKIFRTKETTLLPFSQLLKEKK
ncbi:hypothetical protein [Mycoplasmopsis canis]|uniref:hypothetical protein n=1 Tax=Mycoplasmopsis canis TaxID=29555 RepID=UPI00025AECAD|nr:hypothetical protein [Mycoplasmopsis canis]EIE40744.1 hypothetical protein MCANUF33_01288 [Mycoplasmopsis canis UF33]